MREPPGGGSRIRSIRGELPGERDQVSQRRQPGERLALELTDALARQVELVPDRLERPRLALEAEAKLENPALPLGERIECAAHALATERFLRLVERIAGRAAREA